MKPSECACLILASGLGQRFERGDKLMVPLRGKPLMQHAVELAQSIGFGSIYAVIGLDQFERQSVCAGTGCQSVLNLDPEAGQGSSLALGVRTIEQTDAKAVVILLADMPNIGSAHVDALLEKAGPQAVAMSERDGRTMPPAVIGRMYWPKLIDLKGDVGARSVLDDETIVTVPISLDAAIDVDTLADLGSLELAGEVS